MMSRSRSQGTEVTIVTGDVLLHYYIDVFHAEACCDTVSRVYSCLRFVHCNEVSRYGKKEVGTGEHLTHFNNKINKHK